MRIKLTSVPIDDIDRALKFYTEVMGFVKKHDIPLGGDARWVTVVSPEDPNGVELLLEPNATYPAMKTLKEDLVRDGIPYTAFEVDDVQQEYERLRKLGVQFAMEPTDAGMTTVAILHDSCGNLIQIFQMNAGA
jgi:catechol 2,3-dioxygenase-like lactoylglutathione lyase family enzyme